MSAISAADLDDNNDTTVSSDDAELLSAANDVDAIGDLNENDADSGNKALQNDAKSVAAGEDNEIYSEGYEEAEGDLMSPVLGEGEYTIYLEFSQYYDPQKTTVTGHIERYDYVPIFEGLLTINVDGQLQLSDFVQNDDYFTFDIGSQDIGPHDWEAEFQDVNDPETGYGKGSFTIKPANTAIDISESSIEMLVGETKATGAQLNPSGAGELNYSSSNPDVADVSKNETGAYIIANCPGTATITVSFNGSKNYNAAEDKTITVTVKARPPIYVNAIANPGGNGSQAAPFQTLKEALDNVKNGGTIMIAAGNYTGENNTGLEINKNKLNFIKYGEGEAIFDAESQRRIWTVMDDHISITGLTFKNGMSTSSDGGGAIYMMGGNVINCNFIGNNATSTSNSDGGAIYCSFYTNVTNCTFTDNAASYMGGAIYFFREGSVSDCTFAGNTAKWGGAIRFDNMDNVDDTMTNCAFVNNSAQYGKVISSSGALKSVDNNWWGSNNPDWNELINQGGIPSSYAVLNVTADTQNIAPGSKARLNYAFYRNGTTEILSIPERAITLSATGGDLDDTSGYLVNGEFSTEFSADEIGEYEIAAMVDNQELTINVTVAIPTWYVNASKTSSGDGKSEDTAFMTFKEAIDTASDGDIIMIAAGTYTGNNNTLLIIYQNNLNLIKYGDGEAIFDAESTNRDNIFIFDTNDGPKSVNIKGLTFKNTNFYAITFNGQNAMTDSSINATFTNIGNGQWGSAIFARHADNVDITGTFINNTAGEGLIKIFNDANNIVVHDSIFINNGESSIFTINGSSLIYNNWFGNTADDWNITPTGVDDVEMINWLFLNATTDPSEIGIGKSSTITFDMYYLNFESINKYDGPLNIQLDLNQTLGELDKTVASLGEEITYTAKDTGDSSVTGTFETASYTISLKNIQNQIVTTLTSEDVVTVYKNATGQLAATITDVDGNPLSVELNVELNGETYSLTSGADGQISVPLANLSRGNYVATISYAGNETYAASSTTANVTVNQADSKITALNTTVAYNDPNKITIATISSVYGSGMAVNVNIKLNGEELVVKSNSKGQIMISAAGLDYGTYTAEITYKGYGNYKPANATALITVAKLDTVITPQDVSVNFSNPTRQLIATLTDVNGKALSVYVNVTFNGETYAVKSNSKGQVTIKTNALTHGTYDATIEYGGDESYSPASATAQITVSKADSVITAPDVSVPYKNTTNHTIATITSPYGKALAVYVNVTVNGETYVVRANYKGEVSVSTANLAPGTYNATISYRGNGNYNPSTATTQITVEKADTTISAPDIYVAYKDVDGKLVATLKNAYGKPLSVYVHVNLNGKDYDVLADSNGQIVIPTKTLYPGNHIVTITYNGNGNYNPTTTTAQITVNKANTVITAQDVTVETGNPDGKLVATLTNAYGKALAVYVHVSLNGEEYDVLADSNGQISIPTKDLASGTYSATITYNGNGNYNPTNTTVNITVK